MRPDELQMLRGGTQSDSWRRMRSGEQRLVSGEGRRRMPSKMGLQLRERRILSDERRMRSGDRWMLSHQNGTLSGERQLLASERMALNRSNGTVSQVWICAEKLMLRSSRGQQVWDSGQIRTSQAMSGEKMEIRLADVRIFRMSRCRIRFDYGQERTGQAMAGGQNVEIRLADVVAALRALICAILSDDTLALRWDPCQQELDGCQVRTRQTKSGVQKLDIRLADVVTALRVSIFTRLSGDLWVMPSADRCQQGFDTGSGRTGQTISDAQNETRGGWNKRKEEEDKRRKRNKRRTEQEEDRARGGLNKGRMEQAAIGSRGGWNKGSMEQEEKDGIREGRWNKRRMEQEEKGRGEWDKTMHQEEDDRIGEGRWNKRRIKHEDDGRGGWNRKMEQGEEDGMGDGKWKKRMVREAKGAKGGSNKRWMEQVEKGGGWNKRWIEQEVDGTRGGWNRRRQMENKLDESSDCNSAGPAANHVLVGASLRGESRMIWEDQIQQAFDYGLGRTGQATSGAQKQDSGSADAQLLLAIVSARWSYRFGLVLPPLSCCFPLKVDRQLDV